MSIIMAIGRLTCAEIINYSSFIFLLVYMVKTKKIVNVYDQEIPQSQTADNPQAPRGRAAQPSRDTTKTNIAKQSALFV